MFESNPMLAQDLVRTRQREVALAVKESRRDRSPGRGHPAARGDASNHVTGLVAAAIRGITRAVRLALHSDSGPSDIARDRPRA